MFSTIYAIVWEAQNLIYIGRSKNLNARLAKHTMELEANIHYNHKLQNAYNIYGKYSSIDILETVPSNIANIKEMSWINEFDSVNTGLNLIGGNIKENIDTSIPFIDNINKEDLSQYKFIIVGPDNTVYKINNITEFVKSRPDLRDKGGHIPHSMRKMYREDGVKQCHGYRKYKGIDTYTPIKYASSYLITHNETSYTTTNLAEFCRTYKPFEEFWYSAADCLRAVAAGRYRTYKDHTCVRIK